MQIIKFQFDSLVSQSNKPSTVFPSACLVTYIAAVSVLHNVLHWRQLVETINTN